MLMYLSSDARANLLDFLEESRGILPKKLTGKFSLKQFIVRDFRNYAHCRYFVIDRAALYEIDSDLIAAIHSYNTMHTAQIILIDEGLSDDNPLLHQLIMAGVHNIVTATDIEGIRAEILDCLSEGGMRRYRDTTTTAANAPAANQYRFTARNARIAVAGSQRRSGVTTTCFNLAQWLSSHGASVCYLEASENGHLVPIMNLYQDSNNESHYTVGNIDFYPKDQLVKDYNFIVMDCGVIQNPPQKAFLEAEIRLLCVCAMPYEITAMHAAMESCADMDVEKWGLFVPADLRDFVGNMLRDNIAFAEASHELFSDTANAKMNKRLVQRYIETEAI